MDRIKMELNGMKNLEIEMKYLSLFYPSLYIFILKQFRKQDKLEKYM